MSFLFQSARLGFRTWTEADLPLARALWGDPAVTRYIGGPQTEAQSRDRLHLEMRNQQQRGYSCWPIFALADGAHAGCAGLKPYADDPATLEVGVHLARLFWSGRYGEEAARGVMEQGFAAHGAQTLVARHHPDNANSRALVQRLGFIYSHDEFWAPNRVDCPTYFLRR